jgi:hypothetical protein
VISAVPKLTLYVPKLVESRALVHNHYGFKSALWIEVIDTKARNDHHTWRASKEGEQSSVELRIVMPIPVVNFHY